MNQIYKQKIRAYLPEIYKNFLTSKLMIDRRQVDEIFSDPVVLKQFNHTIDIFYHNSDFGNRDELLFDEAIKYQKTVEKRCGFKDEYFRLFLHIYRFYTSCTYTFLLDDKGNYLPENEKEYFSKLQHVCCVVCDNVFIDLQNGNCWWEMENASSLRRQFLNDIVIMPLDKIQRLCRTYLGREIDIKKELLHDDRSTPPMELVKELDEKMRKTGKILVYSWPECTNGEWKFVDSKTNPPKNEYYFRRYISPELINEK